MTTGPNKRQHDEPPKGTTQIGAQPERRAAMMLPDLGINATLLVRNCVA
jgi:hypothetical protein